MSKQKPKIVPRKPPAPVDPAALARFVAADDASTSKRSDVQTSRSPTTQVTRRDGRMLRRLTIYLPVDLARRMAVRCAEDDRDLSDALAEAAEQWLGSR